MHHLKFADFQAPWVTCGGIDFFHQSRLTVPALGIGLEGRKRCFILKLHVAVLFGNVSVPHFEGVWALTSSLLVGVHQTLTMPLSSLLCSLSSFPSGCATTTLSLLPCANKQAVAYGTWGKVELMPCRTCSICLMIVREMILWYSFSPSPKSLWIPLNTLIFLL